MRLIDAETLAQEIESLRVTVSGRPATWNEAKSDVILIIDEQKTVDAADVLRSQWISVKDRMPKTFERIIVCREGGIVEQGYKDVGDWWKVYGTRTKRVTHWMPLPETPEEEPAVDAVDVVRCKDCKHKGWIQEPCHGKSKELSVARSRRVNDETD